MTTGTSGEILEFNGHVAEFDKKNNLTPLRVKMTGLESGETKWFSAFDQPAGTLDKEGIGSGPWKVSYYNRSREWKGRTFVNATIQNVALSTNTFASNPDAFKEDMNGSIASPPPAPASIVKQCQHDVPMGNKCGYCIKLEVAFKEAAAITIAVMQQKKMTRDQAADTVNALTYQLLPILDGTYDTGDEDLYTIADVPEPQMEEFEGL